ncbi:hypothetical protein [Streptomyces sp. SLBN-115]|uniref:hypothetical protein n=1 Tax=Streptomyces sp. SLBN-115 TaxID=2768453 RepID=UPI0011524850|nr:hypothetical protein [Streptomyces sp. SLBN-115]TQJ57238.1 hypothetical protein FBY34_5084 [Streptomyces sp. SLBN-115]
MRAGLIGLWRWTAWGGIGLSLYAGWLTADDLRDRASSERDISAACDGLVSGAAVMDLQGGMIRAKASDYDEYRIDTRELHSSCTVYKVPGPGKTTSLFTLVVRRSDASEPMNWIGDDSGLEPFYDTDDTEDTDDADGTGKGDVTAVADRRPEAWPVGDGTLGRYGDWYTTVRAECGPGSRATAPELLNVTARADYDDVSAVDRERLARIARTAAEAAADRIGCKTRLAALPGRRPASVPITLRPAKTTGGSCSWFAAHLSQQGQDRLPDRALAIPLRNANPLEGCLLAVGPDQVGRIADELNDDQRDYARSALTHSPWWLRTASYFGPEAHTVGHEVLGGQDAIIEAGTAGHADGAWWASSVCDGKPALHTLSSSYTYDDILGSRRLNTLFRAYVDDITKRRGCTDVTYPDAKDFRSL